MAPPPAGIARAQTGQPQHILLPDTNDAGRTRPDAQTPAKRKYTVTPKAVAARSQNAQKSTGPTTAAGKEQSSHNATTHGLTGRKDSTVVDAEDQADYDELLAKLHRDYPGAEGSGDGEFHLKMVAHIQWKLGTLFPRAEAAAIKQDRRLRVLTDRAETEEAQRRAAQDDGDELAAYRVTATGLAQLAKLVRAFAQELLSKDANRAEFWDTVRTKATSLKTAVPVLTTLTGVAGETMSKAKVIDILERATAQLDAEAESRRRLEAEQKAITHGLAFIPPEMNKYMRYRTELIRELKVHINELKRYRRRDSA